MSNAKTRLSIQAAAYARSIAHLEGTLAEAKAKYWLLIHELHSLDDKGPDITEALKFAEFRAGGGAPGGESLAEMAERYKGDGHFSLAKGAVTSDDT